MALDGDTVRLAKGKNLATVVTLMPDGRPQALLTWIDTDGEHLIVNTEPARQRAKNVARDPRITVLIHSADNPWDWSEVRGRVVETVGGQPARDHIDELSRGTWGPNTATRSGPKVASCQRSCSAGSPTSRCRRSGAMTTDKSRAALAADTSGTGDGALVGALDLATKVRLLTGASAFTLAPQESVGLGQVRLSTAPPAFVG